MKNFCIALFLVLGSLTVQAQDFKDLKSIEPDKDYENILVKKLYSDKYTSTFIVWVKKEVKAHKHATHTEQVGVLEGKAEMMLGDKKIYLKKGDWVVIPEGTVHSVKVLSKKPVKVISIQTPEFKGKDRVFVN